MASNASVDDRLTLDLSAMNSGCVDPERRIARVEPGAWVLNVQARWRNPDGDAHHFDWVRDVFDAMTPYSVGGVYVNWLAEVKAERDQENVFRPNRDIEPAG